VYGDLSTGASNDLVGNTELARKMVREWGMSDRIGPMAWGSQGQVFLGEDLMHTRDYSEHTSQIIDDEVEIILRVQEERALEVLARHRGGLDAVARALLDEETIDGETVGRLVDTAYSGRRTGREHLQCHRPGNSPSGGRSCTGRSKSGQRFPAAERALAAFEDMAGQAVTLAAASGSPCFALTDPSRSQLGGLLRATGGLTISRRAGIRTSRQCQARPRGCRPPRP
jgi:hypothetical protein